MDKVFVDTSAWIAVTVKKDGNHSSAISQYMKLIDEHYLLITSDYVLDETITRIRYDSGHKKATEFIEIINESVTKGLMRLTRIDEGLWDDAIRILQKYDDQKFSFTDCTSFALVKRFKIPLVFAFDDHFRLMEFRVIP